jgi:hypothetical protein
VLVKFSKPMDTSSLATAFQVVGPDSSDSLCVTISWGVDAEGDTFAACELQGQLGPGIHTVTVTSEARDTSGNSLDQYAAKPGDDAFSSAFVITDLAAQMASGPR